MSFPRPLPYFNRLAQGGTVRGDIGLLLLLGLFLIGSGIGLGYPTNVDEERFLGVALEMLQNGHWWIPHRAAEIYPDKPPVFMWAVAAFTALTQAPKLALLLPALCTALLSTLCIYDLGRRLWHRRIGFAAGLLFLATYQTMSVLKAGQIDGLLCLWTTLGVYGLGRHLLKGPAWGWFYLGCAACGLGVISKGVGFLPLLMLIPYGYAVRKNWREVTAHPGSAGHWALGALAFFAAIGLWFVPVVIKAGLYGDADSHAYLANILLKQTGKRFANAWQHREPFWYFFVLVIPKYWLPMVLALPWLVPAWRRQLAKRDARILVLLGWIVLVLVFFSLSTGKRKLYIYPAVPALALCVAPLVPWLMQRWFGQAKARLNIFRGLVFTWFAAWTVWGFVEPLKHPGSDNRDLMLNVAERIGADTPLGLAGFNEGMWLYSPNPLTHFGFSNPDAIEPIARWLDADDKRWALVPSTELARCFQSKDAIAMTQGGKRHDWLLVNRSMRNERCKLDAGTPETAEEFDFRWENGPRL